MLAQKVERYVKQHRLLLEGDRVLVAVSGGPTHFACSTFFVPWRRATT